MEKRILAAIAISIAFLWAWAALAPRIFPELARQQESRRAAEQAAKNRPAAPPAKPEVQLPPAAADAPAPAPAPAVTPVAATSVQYSVVETREFAARFTNRGAQLVSFRLKNYKQKDGSDVELVKPRPATATDFPFAVVARSAAWASRLNSALYQVSERDDGAVRVIEYRYTAPDGLTATKTFRVRPDFMIDFRVDVRPSLGYRVIVGPGIRDVDPKAAESQAALLAGNGIVQQDGDLEILSRESGDRYRVYQAVDYIGIEDNYFLVALRPKESSAATLHRIQTRGPDNKPRPELYAGLSATADGVVSGSALFGPKETRLLDSHGMQEALQYGMFGVIARFLLEALTWINQFTKNYGFAIIVLTILIKIVLYPLQHKSIVSMKKMQKVQPKMEAIKNKYKKAKTDPEQRQKMNVEMMKLYQAEGINPMSGCLPILLQLPILWGFYNLLSRAIELRGAPWILWIHDLSEKDPTYILPILMTATMFIQTYITPTTADPVQRKIFLAMPIVFGIMFKEFPSGLVLYWLVQNVLTIVQQMIMNRWWKDHPDDIAKA
jgi:YidC/Oxa1 family membrane protein insertase